MRARRLGAAARAAVWGAPLLVSVLVVSSAFGADRSQVAALQIGLRSHGLYAGSVDGVVGAETVRAVRVLQRRAGLRVDGVVGPATRRALGRFGRPGLGRRTLRVGAVGWDVARLQFLLAQHGFPLGPLDGRFGARTEAALRGFQRAVGLAADGAAGRATLRALHRPPAHAAFTLAMPVSAPATEGFGPRGGRFHTGVDFPAPAGTPVVAAAPGRVAYAAWHTGGWGWLVTIAHRRGIRTMYAHLSHIQVRVGDSIGTGATVGLVGSSGQSSGPHLHFEVRLRGGAIDPCRVLSC